MIATERGTQSRLTALIAQHDATAIPSVALTIVPIVVPAPPATLWPSILRRSSAAITVASGSRQRQAAGGETRQQH